MRKRDIKIGMEVEHARSGKFLGRVTEVGNVLVHLTGSSPIAAPAEIVPYLGCGQSVPCPPMEEIHFDFIQAAHDYVPGTFAAEVEEYYS